ncbi:MAG TPA: adenine phosphoribosyltransferase [Deltaproteobacteria bacterium]|nr:MAG: adenine phosphoribosyltransferase [Deltaproteobacteria bacterium GWA2_45_12]HBF12529.1 adenine phosphoribosyltransferase [Deltaproteobacteria bacterium]
MEDFKKIIRDVPDFPKPGIVFKDITPLLQDPKVFTRVVHIFGDRYAGAKIDKIVGIESRGFIFGAPLSVHLGIGFVPVRKKGKLPWTTLSQEYALEYGTDELEIHVDSIGKGERVLIVDDLLATGGTVEAVCKLVEKQGGTVGSLAFVVELEFLKGRDKLKNRDIFSIVRY